jgi:hypothetical protein
MREKGDHRKENTTKYVDNERKGERGTTLIGEGDQRRLPKNHEGQRTL